MDPRLETLLRRWAELQARNESVSLEELCAEDAELLDELHRRMAEPGPPSTMVNIRDRRKEQDDPPSTIYAAETPRPRQSPATTLPGRCIGDNEILEELGRGGMGVVFCVWQPQINRVAALKMVTASEYAGGPAFLRFEIEIEAVGRLQHPNIVQIYEVGEHQGRPYYVCEYVPGGNLATLLRDGPLAPAAAAQLVQTLAGAVHHAHERGIVHRDLKPTNVLLTAAGLPKLTDFGLAKLMQADSSLTETGMILGTASYMAPEQALGVAPEIGPRTDVYALGAILYESLTGTPPFRGATLLGTLSDVRDAAAVPPSRLCYVPRDLERICLKCLAKLPADRYATAQDLADDLGRFLAGEPVQVRTVGFVRRIQRWCQKPRRIAEAGAIAIGVGVLLQLWLLLLPLAAAASERGLTRPGGYLLGASLLTLCFHGPLIWGGVQMLRRRYRGVLVGSAAATAEWLLLTMCLCGLPLPLGGVLDDPVRRLIVLPLVMMLCLIGWAACLVGWCAYRAEHLHGRHGSPSGPL